MGDTSAMPGPGSAPFTAGQLFDPTSAYGRMRGCMKPDAKLRGFFHYLAVQQKAKRAEVRPLAIAAKSARPAAAATLVVTAGAPGEELRADVWLELRPFGRQRRLALSFRVTDGAAIAEGTQCRALLLTAGMLERLCGPDAVRSGDAARKAMSRLLAGQGEGDPFEAARVLAAVPEMDGQLEEGGFCVVAPFDLPEQAGHVDELPEKMTVVVVIAAGR